GIDLSTALPQDDIQAIEDVWNERLVVVFHGHKLSDPQLIAFSKNFGELDPPGPNPYGEPFNKEHPELNVISNVVENGKPIGNLGDGEAVWHADMTYVEVPPKAAMLHSLEVPANEALLDALWAHATQARFAMCHEWRVGDVLMWNNLSVLHRRDPFDPKSRRVMHRSQIKGNERIA